MAQTNQIHIDLPGETWVHSAFNGQLDVVLRRPRDVIININLPSPFSKFTLESDKDWFYDVKSKKRVQRKEYTNGERVHLWLGRDFKGSLFLKSGKKIYANFEIQKIFSKERSNPLYDDFSYKPAPLILAASKEDQEKITKISPKQEILHVVEVRSIQAAPSYILSAIRTGSETIKIDPFDVISLNWLSVQFAGAFGYAVDNHWFFGELRKTKIILQRVVHKTGEKHYIILKGFAGLRKIFTASRYAAENAKVLSIFAGAGSAKGTAQAAWLAANPALTAGEGFAIRPTGVGIAVVFSMGVSIAEWYADYCKLDSNGKPSKDFFDLAGSVGIGVAKTMLAGAAGSFAISFLASAGMALAFTPVGLTVGLVAIGVAITVGYVIDVLDKETGLTNKTTAGLRSSWNYLASKEPKFYSVTYRPYGGAASLHPSVNYPAIKSN